MKSVETRFHSESPDYFSTILYRENQNIQTRKEVSTQAQTWHRFYPTASPKRKKGKTHCFDAKGFQIGRCQKEDDWFDDKQCSRRQTQGSFRDMASSPRIRPNPRLSGSFKGTMPHLPKSQRLPLFFVQRTLLALPFPPIQRTRLTEQEGARRCSWFPSNALVWLHRRVSGASRRFHWTKIKYAKRRSVTELLKLKKTRRAWRHITEYEAHI